MSASVTAAAHRVHIAQPVSPSHTESHPTVEEQLTNLVLSKTGKNILGNPNIIGLKVVGNQREGFDIVGFIPSEYRQPYYLKQIALEAVKKAKPGVSLSIDELKVLPIKEIKRVIEAENKIARERGLEPSLTFDGYFPEINEVG